MALVATLAEDLPVSETLQLSRALEGLRIQRGPVVINRVYSPRFNSGSNLLALTDALAVTPRQRVAAHGGAALWPLLAAAQLAREHSDLNERHISHLSQQLSSPQIRLPYLYTTTFDAAAVEELSLLLGDQLVRSV